MTKGPKRHVGIHLLAGTRTCDSSRRPHNDLNQHGQRRSDATKQADDDATMKSFATLPPAERALIINEAAIDARLGAPQHTNDWLRYEIDALAGTPNLLFTYPSALAQAGGYIARQVKLEFGALSDQQPTGAHSVAALLAQTPGVDLTSAYDDL